MIKTGPNIPVSYAAVDARTIGDMFTTRCLRSGPLPAILEKHDGKWVSTSWREFHHQASQVAKGLWNQGLSQGDRVAILGPTQAPWAVYDMGAQLAGMVSFGVYPKQAVDQIQYLLDHSDAKVIFVDGDEEIENVLEAVKDSKKLEKIVPWTEAAFEAYRERDARITSPSVFCEDALTAEELKVIQDGIDPSAMAILIYTSGTTGPPKGAMIAHENVIALLSSQARFLKLNEDDLSFNFLPMAHSAERILGFYGRINMGIAGAYASSVSKVLDEVTEVKPTLFGSVPRIFEKAYAKIHAEIAKKPAPVRHLFDWAKAVGKEGLPYVLEDRAMPFALKAKYAIADRLVFRKIRAAFGGRVEFFITGAAPIAMDILEFMWGAGLPIYEAYGMTEATVVTHINRPGAIRLGTVGQSIAPMECRIAETDGEVLMKGPFVFKGYFKNEEATKATIIDGWLHSGDIGRIDEDGYLRLTDRKKHLIITAGGKNLAPANIENAIKNQDPLISQVHAHGDKRPYVSALIAPSPLETLEWGVGQGVVEQATLDHFTRELMAQPTARSEKLNEAVGGVVTHPEFTKRVAKAVQAGNNQLARVEKVRRFVILNRDFSQEHGELTPTMKVRRRAIESQHAELFDRVYSDPDFATEVQ